MPFLVEGKVIVVKKIPIYWVIFISEDKPYLMQFSQ